MQINVINCLCFITKVLYFNRWLINGSFSKADFSPISFVFAIKWRFSLFPTKLNLKNRHGKLNFLPSKINVFFPVSFSIYFSIFGCFFMRRICRFFFLNIKISTCKIVTKRVTRNIALTTVNVFHQQDVLINSD